jgi:hypothetical protein
LFDTIDSMSSIFSCTFLSICSSHKFIRNTFLRHLWILLKIQQLLFLLTDRDIYFFVIWCSRCLSEITGGEVNWGEMSNRFWELREEHLCEYREQKGLPAMTDPGGDVSGSGLEVSLHHTSQITVFSP